MNTISTVAERNENGHDKGEQVTHVTSNSLTGDSIAVEGPCAGNQFSRLQKDKRANGGDGREVHRQTLGTGSGNGGKKEDENEKFLISLLPYLRDVPKHRKLAVRHKLHKVFIDEQDRRRRGRFLASACTMQQPNVPPSLPISNRKTVGELVNGTHCPPAGRATPNHQNKNLNLYYENRNYEVIGPPNVDISAISVLPNFARRRPPNVSVSTTSSTVTSSTEFLQASLANYYNNRTTAGDSETAVEAAQGGNTTGMHPYYYV